MKRLMCFIVLLILPAVGFASNSSDLDYTVNSQDWEDVASDSSDPVYTVNHQDWKGGYILPYDYHCKINAEEYEIEYDIILAFFGLVYDDGYTALQVDVYYIYYGGDFSDPHTWAYSWPDRWDYLWQEKTEEPVDMTVYLKNGEPKRLSVEMVLSHGVNGSDQPKTDIRGLSVKFENSDGGGGKVKKPLLCITSASQNDHQ